VRRWSTVVVSQHEYSKYRVKVNS